MVGGTPSMLPRSVCRLAPFIVQLQRKHQLGWFSYQASQSGVSRIRERKIRTGNTHATSFRHDQQGRSSLSPRSTHPQAGWPGPPQTAKCGCSDESSYLLRPTSTTAVTRPAAAGRIARLCTWDLPHPANPAPY
jgi:hypothetical protein